MGFTEDLAARQAEGKVVCVGLDPEYSRLPPSILARTVSAGEAVLKFNKQIVEATRDIAGAYKPNAAFYDVLGKEGWDVLKETVDFIHKQAPGVPVIYDGKRADIGNSTKGYAIAVFERLGADAITTFPFLGGEAIEPLLSYEDKGVFILCHTSNPGSRKIQDLMVVQGGKIFHLYEAVAREVLEWNSHGNCGLVMGATYPRQLEEVRKIVGEEMPVLIPGLGAQGGDTEQTVRAGRGVMLINASRSILFASSGEDFAQAARAETLRMQEEIAGLLTQVPA